MDYSTFKKEIVRVLREKAGKGKRVTLHRIEKNNGVVLDAVTIMKKGDQIAPTIYLEEFYEWHCRGTELQEIGEKIMSLNQERHVQNRWLQLDCFEDYQKARSHICYKLINYGLNRGILANMPHIPYLDLAVVFYYRLDQEALRGANFLIHNSNLDTWDISLKELFRDAQLNTTRKLPFTIQGMEEMIRQLTGMGEEIEKAGRPEQMYILTNQEKYFGAAAILYPHVLYHISKIFRNNFYVLPSSIHECILVPDSGQYSRKELEHMVKEVNSTQVDDEEILSDNVYYYDREKQMLTL